MKKLLTSTLLLATLEELFLYTAGTLLVIFGSELVLPGFLVSPKVIFGLFILLGLLLLGIFTLRATQNLPFTKNPSTIVTSLPSFAFFVILLTLLLLSLLFSLPPWLGLIQLATILLLTWFVWKK